MAHTCLIDLTTFESKKDFHAHLRKLKIKVEDYYQEYEPKFDLWDGEPIEYKNEDFYLNTLFNTRENLIEYTQKYRELDTLKEVIKLRKEWKNLIKAPSTVESRLSVLPSPYLIEWLGHDYNELCKELGLKSIYNYSQTLTFANGPIRILRDTREQNPLSFNGEVIQTALDFGDYTSASHYKKVFVERKSLEDLVGTLSGNFERFRREVERAQSSGATIIVVIEKSITELADENRLVIKHSKATSKFIGSRIKDLYYEYDNIQFLFVKSRQEMARTIEQIFRLNEDISAIDLQYYYDKRAFR